MIRAILLRNDGNDRALRRTEQSQRHYLTRSSCGRPTLD
jgi:hypothetical protein